MKMYVWFLMHLAGLIGMILVWSDNSPMWLFPGLFGLIVGAMYSFGTIKLIETARAGKS